MVRLTVKEVEFIAFSLARELLTFDEPIPDFSTRFPNILESCLITPFQRFAGRDLYPTLIRKASMLFYLMIKNHPFQNGNKRIAMTALFVFLYRNKKWIEVDKQELYHFTVEIAKSSPRFKDGVVKAIEEFLRAHIVNLSA